MKKSWKKYKINKGNNDLFKAVLHAYRKDYIISILMGFLSSGLELSTPFFVKAII